MIRLLSQKYKEYLDSTRRKQTTLLITGPKTFIKSLPKNMYKCQICILKDAQHHIALENCKFKQHCTYITIVETPNIDNAKYW